MQPFKPYCAHCASVKPDHIVAYTCGPCANAGHIYGLVTTEEVRQERITRWREFYDKYGYTEAERNAIPSWRNLNTIPPAALITPEGDPINA